MDQAGSFASRAIRILSLRVCTWKVFSNVAHILDTKGYTGIVSILAMSQTLCQIPTKTPGGKKLFKPEVEQVIAFLYYDQDIASESLADYFKLLSKTRRCSAAAIRLAARRGKILNDGPVEGDAAAASNE